MRAECLLKLTEFVSDSAFEEIPSKVIDHAGLVLLDMLGVMVRGADSAQAGRLRRQTDLDIRGDIVCPGAFGRFFLFKRCFPGWFLRFRT